jgi:hypothetical protein
MLGQERQGVTTRGFRAASCDPDPGSLPVQLCERGR